MSQALDLLNSLTGTTVDHKHVVPDSDTYFLIDPYTRQIENTTYNKTVLMRGDHNSERFTFEVPRYVDGHDMSLCNRVIVHFDNVGDSIENVHHDVAYMDDLRINPDKPETVISSWLIRREATQIVGILSFSLQYQCVEGDDVTYEWNTDSYDDIEIRKSKNNGEAAVINYTNVLEQWRSQIFGAGDSVMSNITNEGATQVTAVKNESATQQAAIELKGSETLATIPDDYTEVYNMASEAVRTKADGVICEGEGSAITISDASNDYIRGLNVYGKSTQVTTTGAQLAYIPDVETYENNGIIWSSNGGVVTAKGIAQIHSYTPSNIYADLKGLVGTFYLSGNGKYIKVAVQYTRDGVTSYVNAPQEFTLDGSETRVDLYCQITTYNVDINDTAYPMINAGNTALPWELYTGGMAAPNPDYPQDIVSIENPAVEVCGKNLARSNRDGVLKSFGATITQTNNSSEVIIDGTTTGATSITVFRDIYLRAGQYTISVDGLNVSDASYDRAYMMDGSANAIVNYVQPGRPQTFTIREPKRVSISIVFAEGTTYSNRTVKFQLEEGSVATEYEPYNGATISTVHSLHGIPVTSGGNYTDENGQQWICDEVDLERGVYIQRIGRLVLDGDSDWNLYNYQTQYYGFHIWDVLDEQHQRSPGICNQFETVGGSSKDCLWVGVTNKNIYAISEEWYDKGLDAWKSHLNEKPLDVIYARVTPIETPLTAEEIETYKSIKTNYPNTTVTNNAGAWMKIKYNADTKLYIDNAAVNDAASVIEEVLNETY